MRREKGQDWRMKEHGDPRERSKNIKGIEESFWRNRKLSGIDKCQTDSDGEICRIDSRLTVKMPMPAYLFF